MFSFNKEDENEVRKNPIGIYSTLIDKRASKAKAIQIKLTTAETKLIELKERHALEKIELDVYRE